MAAKREALRASDALAEHFRSRAVTAETEVVRLLHLQTAALANVESHCASLEAQRDRISRCVYLQPYLGTCQILPQTAV